MNQLPLSRLANRLPIETRPSEGLTAVHTFRWNSCSSKALSAGRIGVFSGRSGWFQ
jgi:hypothetical protein